MQHPGAGLRQKAQPAGLRAQKQIRRAHPGGDGDEYRQDDRRRLRKGEAQRRSQKWRGARRGQHSCEDALEKRAEKISAFARRKQAASHALRQ